MHIYPSLFILISISILIFICKEIYILFYTLYNINHTVYYIYTLKYKSLKSIGLYSIEYYINK